MSPLKIITTRDGSHSLLNEQLNETYHSVHGALQESKHVFIDQGLDFVSKDNRTELQIFEVGFGTGLNALLTLVHGESRKFKIHYTSLEAFPVDKSIWSELNYATTPDSKMWFEKLHDASWNKWIEISPAFQLRKLHTTLQQVDVEENKYDLIYFDAFAPNKQPEMWELPMLRKISSSMKDDGVFVTYCAKGQLKRDLQSLGLRIETLQGPPGKREMIRAVK